ncbi:ATS13 metalloproteinase, partial [Crypturellus soui]|nr:ATS13 metalloproteinase [Crypturellus soui]
CHPVAKPESRMEVCNVHPCPPRWKVAPAGPCSSTCGPGLAVQQVTCVQRHQGQEVLLEDHLCPGSEKPLTSIPCVTRMCSYEWGFSDWTECSTSCGNGVQTRQDFCINPLTRKRVNPVFCRHFPKPLVLRGCSAGPCLEQAAVAGGAELQAVTPATRPVTAVTTKGTRYKELDLLPSAGPCWSSGRSLWMLLVRLCRTGVCGKLFLNATGVVNMTAVESSGCTVTIGRPLGEEITVSVLESSLNCTAGEFLLFSGRMMWRKGCRKLPLSLINSRTNTLVVKQRLLMPGNGVILQYSSRVATKKYYQDCDKQLFGPRGEIVYPVQLPGRRPEVCRTFINVAPGHRVAIHALYIDLGNDSNRTQSNYVLIRDVNTMKMMVFHGKQQFFWESTGSQVEIEFHE